MPVIGGCSASIFGNNGGPDIIDLRSALNSSAASGSDVAMRERLNRGDWTKWLFSGRRMFQNSYQATPETQTSIYAPLFRGRA